LWHRAAPAPAYWLHGGFGEYVYVSADCLYLCLSLQGGGKRKIQLAGGAWFSGVVSPDQARLMLALADVLAGSPDCGATGQESPICACSPQHHPAGSSSG
jgi:hypothetical protein